MLIIFHEKYFKQILGENYAYEIEEYRLAPGSPYCALYELAYNEYINVRYDIYDYSDGQLARCQEIYGNISPLKGSS